jgi:hypothetical protein
MNIFIWILEWGGDLASFIGSGLLFISLRPCVESFICSLQYWLLDGTGIVRHLQDYRMNETGEILNPRSLELLQIYNVNVSSQFMTTHKTQVVRKKAQKML